ncbi:GerMN domain-containing protein [Modestobacter sp. NPDC049651]|uniref:GerMN domain-containing protein n=1 Tax=unclassified Modestobacter TaxID=2643866 RepID=UPI0033CD39C2
MRARRALVAAAAVGLLAGCGVPTGGAPETIPPSEVPFGLASSSPAARSTAPAPDAAGRPQVYLVGADEALVPRTRELSAGSPREQLAELLDDLSAGPQRDELADRLSTALPPELTLDVAETADGTVSVALGGSAEAPSGRASKRAVAQIVLTATSLPWVAAVVLTHDGRRLDAPLPSGELTAEPLTAADYRPLLTPSPTPTG